MPVVVGGGHSEEKVVEVAKATAAVSKRVRVRCR